jgi:hypothetical protein
MLAPVMYRALIVQAWSACIWLTVGVVTTALIVLCGVRAGRVPASAWLTFCGIMIVQEWRRHRRPYPDPAPAAAQLADMRETLSTVLRVNGRIGAQVFAMGAAFGAAAAIPGLFIDNRGDWWFVPCVSLGYGLFILRETMSIRAWERDHLRIQLVEAFPDGQPRYTWPRGWGDERAAGDR